MGAGPGVPGPRVSQWLCAQPAGRRQVVSFLTAHLGNPIPSPAIFDKIGTAFRRAVTRFAADEHTPRVRFAKDDRKIEAMRPYLAAQAATGRPLGGRARGGPGVRAGVHVHRCPTRRHPRQGGVVLVHQGRPAGDLLLLLPLGRRVRAGLSRSARTSRTRSRSGSMGTSGPNAKPRTPDSGFTELSNGFASAEDPAGLAICNRLGPATLDAFAERWFTMLPLTEHDRAVGCGSCRCARSRSPTRSCSAAGGLGPSFAGPDLPVSP